MNNKNYFGAILGLVVILLIAWGGYSSWQSRRPNTSGPRQAIFLADGQIYFGYASSMRNQIVTLVDVYYLRAPTTNDNKTPIPATSQQVDLIKLGDELYGPKDRMEINRDGIKYIEDMKDDSQINQKITEFLNKKK